MGFRESAGTFGGAQGKNATRWHSSADDDGKTLSTCFLNGIEHRARYGTETEGPLRICPRPRHPSHGFCGISNAEPVTG
jgi:hypothetical protein